TYSPVLLGHMPSGARRRIYLFSTGSASGTVEVPPLGVIAVGKSFLLVDARLLRASVRHPTSPPLLVARGRRAFLHRYADSALLGLASKGAHSPLHSHSSGAFVCSSGRFGQAPSVHSVLLVPV